MDDDGNDGNRKMTIRWEGEETSFVSWVKTGDENLFNLVTHILEVLNINLSNHQMSLI